MNETLATSTDLTPDYFLRRLEEATQFADQNERYATLQSDPTFDDTDVAEFRSIGKDALYEEQLDTRAVLLEKDNDPYVAIADAVKAKNSELHEAQSKLETITDEEDERKSRLLAAVRRVTELAPYAEDAASKLASEKILAIKHLDRQGLSERIGQIGVELSQLEESLRVSQEPWPVPLVIRDYDLAMQKALETATEEVVLEDEIPLDPETHEPSEALRKLIERHGYTHKASIMLTAFFMEHPDTIFMPQQIGTYLYTDESHFAGMTEAERDRCISIRIHSLLNQHEFVKPMLEEAGYKLQYGYRHYINPQTGKSVQRKRRIYRAVEIAEQPDAPDTFSETVYSGSEPEVTTPAVTSVTPEQSSALTAEAVSPEASEHARHIIEVAEQLWALDLLPCQVDDTLTVRTLRTKILQLPQADRNLPAVQKLLKKAAATVQNRVTDATDIVMSAVQKKYEPKHSDKEYRRVQIVTTSVLEQFYESLAA